MDLIAERRKAKKLNIKLGDVLKLQKNYLVILVIISILLMSSCIPIINSMILKSKNLLIIDYISNDAKIEYIYSQFYKPSIIIEDKNGKSYPMVINIYTALPNAKHFYIGRVSGQGVAYLSTRVMDNFKKCAKEWISKRGGIKYFKAGTLLFIDVLVKINSTAYKVYSILKSVPLSLELISKGYKPNIRITINLSRYKPTGKIDLSKNKNTQESRILSNNEEVNEGCVVLSCGTLFCRCYCSKWVLEKTHYTFQHKLVPLLMAASFYKEYPPPPEPIYIRYVHLYFKYTYSENSWFKVFISAKISGLESPELILYNYYLKHQFEEDKVFYNTEFEEGKYNFTNDFIAAIGIYGSGLAGMYRKYEATGICGLIDDDDYSPTDVTANMTVFDIDAEYKNGIWTAETDYDLDDYINGYGWLEKYWNYLVINSKYDKTLVDTDPPLTYIYNGKVSEDVDLSIGLIELMAAFLTEMPPWADYFPFDVAIGWGEATSESTINMIIVETPPNIGSFTIYMDAYEAKVAYIYNGNNYRLPIMLFDITVEKT